MLGVLRYKSGILIGLDETRKVSFKPSLAELCNPGARGALY